jgi:hydrogenase nickel incorporation protein HypA/HybF
MHELALATAIRDAALRHCGGSRVTAVRVRAGAMRQVVPDSLRFYFAVISRGTSCESATLEIEPVPARLRCRSCGHAWLPRRASFRCGRCGRADVEVRAGAELEVESIDVEEPQAPGSIEEERTRA